MNKKPARKEVSLCGTLTASNIVALRNLERRAEQCDQLQEAADAVAAFIGGAKDRLGRPDPSANDAMREARARVLLLATKHGVQGGHHTYLDQCAALLNAAIRAATPD